MKKTLLMLAAGLVGLIGLAFLLVWLLFDPNDYRADVEAGFERATGRTLHLRDDLRMAFFPWLGVATGSAEVGNRDGFGAQPFAALRDARIGVRLLPLLTQRRVEVGRVTVEGLQLNLQVDSSGSDNWSDLLERLSHDATSKPKDDAAGQQEPLTLSIASLHFVDSRLSFDDRQADNRYVIDDWDLETGPVEPGRPVDSRTRLHVTRNGTSVGQFDLASQVDLATPGTAALERVHGRMRLAGIGPDEDGLSLEIATPRIAMDSATRDLRIEDLEGRLPGLTVVTSVEVTQGDDGPTVRGSLIARDGRPRLLLESLGVAAPKSRDAEALRSLAGTAQFTVARNQLQLASIDVQLDDARLQGELAMPDVARGAVRFELTADRLDLDRYLPPPGPATPAPAAEGPVAGAPPPRENTASLLRGLDIDGSLQAGTLVAAGVTLQDVQARLFAREGLLRADPVEARAFGGKSTTRLMLDVRAAMPVARVEQSLIGVDVGPMLGQLIDIRPLEGRGRARFKLDMSGLTARQLLASAVGDFDLAVEDGTLVGVDLWHEIERAVASAQGKTLPPGGGTGRTQFDRLAGRGTFGKRVLVSDRLEFHSSFIKVKGAGRLDLGRNRVALDLETRLLKLPPGRVLGLEVRRIEGAKIPVAITGSIGKPEVEPDVTALLGAIATSVVKEPFGGKVKKKLKKWLER